MKQRNYFLTFFFVVFFLASCQTVSNKKETKMDAPSAIRSVVSGVTGKGIRAQYCPKCGRHYGARVGVCPVDGAGLKEIED